MMLLQTISERTTISDEASMINALKDLRKVPDHELHYYLVLRDTSSLPSHAARQTISLAQVEYDRRNSEQTRQLAKDTTLWSGTIGVIGGLAGAVVGALLTYFLKG